MKNYRLPTPPGHPPGMDGVHALLRLGRLPLPLALPFVLFACSGGDGGTEPQEPGLPAVLEIVQGDGQEAVRGGPFPEPIVVELRDADGNGVGNRTLAVNDDGDGWAADPSPRTDANGRAAIHWYAAADGPSTQTLVVSSGELAADVEGQVIQPEPGTSYRGRREWVEYIPGRLPLVITAPHGGTQEPDDIPDRSGEDIVTVRDSETDDMAHRLGDALEERVGARPHLIILHLHRKKLDANRDIGEAAQGDPLAERTWREFQHWAETAKAIVREDFGDGFYMDLHGHGKHQNFELGFLLNRNDLELDDEVLDASWAVAKSSLRTLAESSSLSFPELVRGDSSLGALYEAEGYTSIPSPERPHPTGPFFAGGYNTQRHACRDGGTICGYQLELNWQDVRSSASSRQDFAEAHARVMEEFFRVHLGIQLGG